MSIRIIVSKAFERVPGIISYAVGPNSILEHDTAESVAEAKVKIELLFAKWEKSSEKFTIQTLILGRKPRGFDKIRHTLCLSRV